MHWNMCVYDTVWECMSIFVEKVKRDLEIYYFSLLVDVFFLLLCLNIYAYKIFVVFSEFVFETHVKCLGRIIN